MRLLSSSLPEVIGQIRAMKPAIDARRDEARRMARPARVEDSYRDPNMRTRMRTGESMHPDADIACTDGLADLSTFGRPHSCSCMHVVHCLPDRIHLFVSDCHCT